MDDKNRNNERNNRSRWDKFRPGTFRARLLLGLLLVTLVTQLITAAALLRNTYAHAMQGAKREMAQGAQLADNVLQQRAGQKLQNVQVLAADFGFKSAVATQDRETLGSVLANQSLRAGADMAVLYALDGAPLASYPMAEAPAFPLQSQQDGLLADSLLRSVVFAGRAYQMVLVPVKAPNVIAWVGMGFALDEKLAANIKTLTALDVVFLQHDRGAGAATSLLATSLTQADQNSLKDWLASNPQLAAGRAQSGLFESPDGSLLLQAQPLRQRSDPAVHLLLVQHQEQALASYYQLRAQWLGILALSLLIGTAVAMLLARAISRPVLGLTLAAQRIGRGESIVQPQERRGELGMLAQTLWQMQQDIHGREEQLRHLSRHDQLTGLPNRVALDEVLCRQIQHQRPCYLLSISILEFTEINDTLGYDIGNLAQSCTALRLRGVLPDALIVARTSGNSFMAVVPHCDKGTLADRLARMSTWCQEPMTLKGTPLEIHIAIGVLKLPDHADNLDTLRRRMKIALDRARVRDNHCFFYTNGLDENHLRELTIIADLREALALNRLYMVYQPKVRFEDNRPEQVEALVRWQHPEMGFIPPDEFILLAERSGQIQKLSGWVLRTVFRQLDAWQEEGLSIGVAINLSAHDLANMGLPHLVGELLTGWGGDASHITLEVTESALMADPQRAALVLKRLKILGVRIAVDDFGTGYSSLAQLKRLTVDELKIDKSFVLKLDENQHDQTIVRSTIDLGHSLGLRIVAEGIENENSWHLLKAYGCDTAQGYYIAKPMPANDLPDWLEKYALRQPR